MQQTKSENQTFTYQTRLSLNKEQSQILSAYAKLMGTIERTLFADLQRGKKSGSLKSDYLKRYAITARQFNSLRVQVEGKIASIKELRKDHIFELTQRIASLEKKIEKEKNEQTLHQKKRRHSQQTARLQKLKEDDASGKVRLCFGTRKLFRAQFHLTENGYESHDAWKEDWQKARSNQIFLVGSKDETSGNQSCTARIQEDGNLTLRLRLPDSMFSEHGKYMQICDVRFKYGHEAIVASLHSCLERSNGNKEAGVAISYRFQCDEKGWRLFVSTPLQKPQIVTHANLGAIGVDINVDHIAVAEVDRYGNCVKHKSIPLPLNSKSTDQIKAIIGDAVAQVISWCVKVKKPLVLEKLCFQDKKTKLREETSAKQAKILSSFAYNTIIQTMKSRGYRFGVQVNQVNPAYTSIIGRCKFATRYGLTIHESAAMVIARRFQGVSESIPRHLDKIPDGKNGHVTSFLPARNRNEHVWASWRQVQQKLLAARTGRIRATTCRSSSRSPPACCDNENISNIASGILARESSAVLLG